MVAVAGCGAADAFLPASPSGSPAPASPEAPGGYPTGPAVGPAGSPSTASPPAPSSGSSGSSGSPSPPPWTLALTFSGDLNGTMTSVVPNRPDFRSECTGYNSKRVSAFAATFAGTVGGQEFALVILVNGYQQPGAFTAPVAVIEVHDPARKNVWQSRPGDPVQVMVAPGEERGSIDATLTNAANGSSKLRVTGTWSCRTGAG